MARETLESIAKSNCDAAVESAVGAGGSRAATLNAGYSYYQNTYDTAKNQGYTERESLDCSSQFQSLFVERTGIQI